MGLGRKRGRGKVKERGEEGQGRKTEREKGVEGKGGRKWEMRIKRPAQEERVKGQG